MPRGHRPGHRSGGREASASHPPRDRVLVLPGEELPSHGLKPGPGTYRVGARLFASQLGLLDPRPPVVQVVPLSGRYLPKPGDQVVGTVTDVQSTFWLLDIGAPRWAPLHMTGTPWKVEVGETERYLRVGDAVVVRVENLDATGRIGVTMAEEGLGKLEGGTIERISPARVPRLVGRGGSMIATITRHTGAEVAIGQNGRIWVGGSADAIQRVRDVLQMIEENGPRPGLTDRVERFLLATTPTTAGAEEADGRVLPHDGGPSGEDGAGAGDELADGTRGSRDEDES